GGGHRSAMPPTGCPPTVARGSPSCRPQTGSGSQGQRWLILRAPNVELLAQQAENDRILRSVRRRHVRGQDPFMLEADSCKRFSVGDGCGERRHMRVQPVKRKAPERMPDVERE